MAEKFYSLLTEIGQVKVANAIAIGDKINFAKMKVGDGGGSYYDPTENQTELKNVVWEGNINQVSVDDDNPNWIHIEVMIPSTDGGFWIREYGVYDDFDNLLGICKCAETYKPIISDGSVKEMLLDMVLCVINTDVVELKIDPTIIFAKKSDIIKLENKIENINWTKAMGTQNDLLIPITGNMYDLLNRTFIAKYNNDNTKATKINGLPLYKANSTNNVTLKKGRAYTVWYDNTNNCFFLKASATGDAKADEVLAGKIVSTDEDTDIIGTMPNNTSTQNCTNVTYKSNKVIFNNIPWGCYPTTNKVQTDVSKVTSALGITADKIKDGETIGDVTGNVTIESMGGTKKKTDTVTAPKGSTGIEIDMGFTVDYLVISMKTASEYLCGGVDVKNTPLKTEDCYYINSDNTASVYASATVSGTKVTFYGDVGYDREITYIACGH